MDDDPYLPATLRATIEKLLTETEIYFNGTLLNESEQWDAKVQLLGEFCYIVHPSKIGCLIIPLTFKDVSQLSRFIANLKHIAQRLQAVIVAKPLRDILELIAAKEKIAEEHRKVLTGLMQEVVSRIGMQLSISRQQMLNFLKGTDEPNIEVTIIPKIYRRGCAASRGDIMNFAKPLKSYKLVYKELLELGSVSYKYSLM